jgi:hypothetical protein
MDLVTIDFETFYSKEYGLGKLTTEEYVRSDLFEVIGVSVKVNNNPTDWYTGSDPGTFLNSLDYSDKAILCHNTVFDGAILSWVFGIKPKFWFDTLSMARPFHQATVGGSLKNLVSYYHLGKKGDDVESALGLRRKEFSPSHLAAYGRYCVNDTELTYQLFQKLMVDFPVKELMVIDQTIRMYTEPQLELDRTLLEEHLVAEKARKLALLEKLGGGDPEVAKKMLTSNVKFAALLSTLGLTDIPHKISPATGKSTFAFAKTDKGMKDLLNHENRAVAAVAEVRLGVKSSIEETRTARLIEVSKRGPLPIMLNYYGAHTGRFSGGDKLNLQNLPARKNNTIRRAICAPEGHKLVACDSSQIEARMLAYFADQADLTQAFREGRDVYSEFASDVYGLKVTKADKDKRFVGKTCILGLGYGMGHAKFRDTLRMQGDVIIDEHEAKRIVYLYRNKYPRITKMWTRCDTLLNELLNGGEGMIADLITYDAHGIRFPNGLRLKYNALRANDDGFEYIADARQFRKHAAEKVSGADQGISWTNIYGGKVVENVIQGLARIIVSDQMVEIGTRWPVLFQVHDENIILAADHEVDVAQRDIETVMSRAPSWAPSLPIACESGVGLNYGEAK